MASRDVKATLKFRARADGAHVRVRVYAAVGGTHLGYCGELVMRPDEWDAMQRHLQRGPLNKARTVDVVWDESSPDMPLPAVTE